MVVGEGGGGGGGDDSDVLTGVLPLTGHSSGWGDGSSEATTAVEAAS